MKPLASILSRVLNSGQDALLRSEKEGDYDLQIWTVWNRVVGDQIAQRAQPHHLKGSFLYVEVKVPTWLQPLREIGPQLLENLNRVLSRKISRIVFFQRSYNRNFEAARATQIKNKEQLTGREVRWYERISLNPIESQEIEQELNQISDVELREVISRVRIKAAKLEKLRSKF
jgi:hypothetical protein